MAPTLGSSLATRGDRNISQSTLMRLRSGRGLKAELPPTASEMDSPQDGPEIQPVLSGTWPRGRAGRQVRLRMATWNTMGMSDELLNYVQGLGYDVVALTELRGVHAELRGKRLITCQGDSVSSSITGWFMQ